jgi:hypothetical protein
MPGLVPGIHAVVRYDGRKNVSHRLLLQQQGCGTAWIPATSAGMTPLVGCGLTFRKP